MSEKNNEAKRIVSDPMDSFCVLKVLAMLGMPFVHVIESLENCNRLTEELYRAYDIVTALTIFGPTIFMICFGMDLSGKTGYKKTRKLGIQLIIINTVLNIVRFVVPAAIAYSLVDYKPYVFLLYLLLPDIYSFAGFFLIFYSFAVRYKLSSSKLLISAVVMSFISALTAECFSMDTPILSTVLGNFIPVSYDSYFPLFSMSIYPCMGIIIKEKILSLDTLKRRNSFAVISASSLAALAILSFMSKKEGTSLLNVADDYAQNSEWGFIVTVTFIAVSLLVISVFYLLYSLVPENPIIHAALKLSLLLMPFYVLQWAFSALFVTYLVPINSLFIGWRVYMTVPTYIGLSLLVEILSLGIVWKRGFSLSKWILKKSDYTRWFHRKNVKDA